MLMSTRALAVSPLQDHLWRHAACGADGPEVCRHWALGSRRQDSQALVPSAGRGVLPPGDVTALLMATFTDADFMRTPD